MCGHRVVSRFIAGPCGCFELESRHLGSRVHRAKPSEVSGGFSTPPSPRIQRYGNCRHLVQTRNQILCDALQLGWHGGLDLLGVPAAFVGSDLE